MEPSERTIRLLEEIRDLQRENLAEYRKTAEHSLAMQKRSVERQEQYGRLYQRALIVGALLITGIVALILYLLRFLFY